jgi:hypothetical protein
LEGSDKSGFDPSVDVPPAARDLSQHQLANEQEMSYAAFVARGETFMASENFERDFRLAIDQMELLISVAKEIGDIETEVDLRRARLMMQLLLKEIEGVTDSRSGGCLPHAVIGGSRFGPH